MCGPVQGLTLTWEKARVVFVWDLPSLLDAPVKVPLTCLSHPPFLPSSLPCSCHQGLEPWWPRGSSNMGHEGSVLQTPLPHFLSLCCVPRMPLHSRVWTSVHTNYLQSYMELPGGRYTVCTPGNNAADTRAQLCARYCPHHMDEETEAQRG